MNKAIIYFDPPAAEAAEMREVLAAAGLELVAHPEIRASGGRSATAADLTATLDGVQAAILGGENFTKEVIAAAPDLKVISRIGVGFDRVDLEASRTREIPVVVAVGSNHVTVAEFAFGLVLALARGIVTGHQAALAGEWGMNIGTDLRDKTLGVAGLGRIGRTVVEQAAGFGMDVLAFEAFPDERFVADHGVRLVDFDTLCREADFLSLHLPLADETREIVTADRLATMKETAYLVNTARGELIDEDALYAALTSGEIAGAGLDVFVEEPPRESPFVGLDNVIISNHMAGVSNESMHRMLVMAAQNAAAVLKGEWSREIVVNGVYS
jgi:D-3-phosphoglycerate dehydrogenase / 2-oxoglutarate reductase